ncbi:MAG: hypothetical protein JWN04_421 [Myxococcaceae bacterium]|nr:hypothetical protein [Myxococcaceae bacterium]
MRIGVVGPAEEDPKLLREAGEFLLGDCGVEQAFYLGPEATLHRVLESWSSEVMRGAATDERFLEQALALALHSEPSAIHTLLARDRERQRLSAFRAVPTPPARAVELFDDKVVLFVHDKAQLDQEDIANAFLIVYGRSKQGALHRFGPRTFFTPGPLKLGRVAVLERGAEGHLAIEQFDPRTGEPRGSDIVHVRRSRMVVTP